MIPEISVKVKEVKITRPEVFVKTVESILSSGKDVHVKLSGTQVIILEESRRKILITGTGPIGGQ